MGQAAKYLDAFLTMPLGLSSAQCCYEDPSIAVMLVNEVAKEGACSKSVFRIRTHYGGHVECQSNLCTY
jgi:hypothetical protein